eukprot:COSAG01_NODE_2881_length_6915_cov_5.685739_1_plen_822_part_00
MDSTDAAPEPEPAADTTPSAHSPHDGASCVTSCEEAAPPPASHERTTSTVLGSLWAPSTPSTAETQHTTAQHATVAEGTPGAVELLTGVLCKLVVGDSGAAWSSHDGALTATMLSFSPMRASKEEGGSPAGAEGQQVTEGEEADEGERLALPVADIDAVRVPRDEEEAGGCDAHDCAFRLSMKSVGSQGGKTYVLVAASVEERRGWLAMLAEVRKEALFAGSCMGPSLQLVLDFAEGPQIAQARQMLQALTLDDIPALIHQGPFQNGITMARAASLVRVKLALDASLDVIATIRAARAQAELPPTETTEVSLHTEVKADLAEVCAHLGIATKWEVEGKKAPEEGWEKKSELGEGSWAVQLRLPFGRLTWANFTPRDEQPGPAELLAEFLPVYMWSTRMVWENLLDPVLFDGATTYEKLRDSACGSTVQVIRKRNARAILDGQIGEVNRFVSQVLGSRFEDTVEAVRNHAQQHGIDPRDLFLWIDEFSLCFPVASEEQMRQGQGDDYVTIFRKNVKRCGWTLAVMTPWRDPVWARRIWCVDEGYESAVAGTIFSVGLTEAEEADFMRTLVADPEAVIDCMSGIDIRLATAFNPADVDKIFALIRAMEGDGFVTINLMLKDQLRAWVAQTARSAVKRARAERGAARTPEDWRMVWACAKILGAVSTGDGGEVKALVVEALRRGAGLEAVPLSEVDEAEFRSAMLPLRTHPGVALHAHPLLAMQGHGPEHLETEEGIAWFVGFCRGQGLLSALSRRFRPVARATADGAAPVLGPKDVVTLKLKSFFSGLGGVGDKVGVARDAAEAMDRCGPARWLPAGRAASPT